MGGKAKEAQRLLKKYQKLTGIDDWDIRLKFYTENVADCEARPEYLDAVLYLDLDKIPPEELDSWIRHEVLHCLVWSLAHLAETLTKTKTEKELVRIEEEKLVTLLERMSIWSK
ncbi:MAG: hypothetical protein ACE5HY_05125 [Candidatus Hydrothermarchaeales archaeon]